MAVKAALSQRSPKRPGLMVSVSPLSSSPALAHCHSSFFNFSKAIKCDTNCLPSVSATTRKRKRGGGQTHEPGYRHKIILHNTREFKEALPIPPSAPHPFLLWKKEGGDEEEKGGAGGTHQKKAAKFTPQSRFGIANYCF